MAKQLEIGGLVFVKSKSVTRPILRMDGSKPVYFRIDGPIVQAVKMEGGRAKRDANGNELPPPEIMPVTNLETGEESTVVVNKVLGSELRENYSEDSYVGHSFCVQKIAPAGNKRYATFDIAEIQLQGEKAVEPEAKHAEPRKGKK